MSAAAKYTVTLSPKQSAYVDSLIATGAYKAAEDVILEGLTVLQDRDASLDDWLRAEVLSAYDAIENGTDPGHSAEDVGAMLKDLYEAHKKTTAA
jgi:antitoxin ParD1/3/4